MLETFLVYTTLIIFMIYFTRRSALTTGRRARFYYCIPVVLYTLVFGLRYCVGMDYMAYLEIYKLWDTSLSINDNIAQHPGIFEHLERSFMWLIIFLKKILNAHYSVFFILFAFLEISLIYRAFRERKEVLASSIFAFFALGIATNLFQNTLRQDVAMCIFLASIPCIIKRDWVNYFIGIALACFFHKSALILLPIYFFYTKDRQIFKSDITRILTLTAFVIIAYFDLTNKIILQFYHLAEVSGYGVYVNSQHMVSNGASVGIGMLIKYAAYCIMIMLYKPVKEFHQDRFFEILFDLVLIGLCGHLLCYRSLVLDRIFRYFTTFEFLIFGYYLVYFRHAPKTISAWLGYLYIILLICMTYAQTILYSNITISTYSTIYQTEKHAAQEKNRTLILKAINENAQKQMQ